MPSANSFALKKFFTDFNRFYEKQGTKKLKSFTERIFRGFDKKNSHQIRISNRFSDRFYNDVLSNKRRDLYCQFVSYMILDQILGKNKISTIINPEEIQKRYPDENPKKQFLLELRQNLEQTVKELKEANPSISLDKELFILLGLLFSRLGDFVLLKPAEIFSDKYENIEEFIDRVTFEFQIPPEEKEEDTSSEPGEVHTFQIPTEITEHIKASGSQETDLNESKPEASDTSENQPNTSQETASLNANSAPEEINSETQDELREKNEQPSFSSYPREVEEDEVDPEQFEVADFQRVYDSDYLTGQLTKNGKYWLFCPLYSWKDGEPTYITDRRFRFGDTGSVTLNHIDTRYTTEKNKLYRGALYNIEIKDSDLKQNNQGFYEIDGPRLFREKKIYRADSEAPDNDYRRAYYVVEPANENWSIEDDTVDVKLAGLRALTEDIEDLFNIPVLLNTGTSFIGPLRLVKNGIGLLTVQLHPNKPSRFVYDSYGANGDPVWPMDATEDPKVIPAVFTYPLFTRHKQIDLISDDELLLIASKAIPQERDYIEKLESWLHELPTFNGKTEEVLSDQRIKRLREIIADNKRVGKVFASLVPSVTKLFTSEVEGKAELVKEVANAIANNPEAIALLHPDPNFKEGLEKLKGDKKQLETQIQELKDSYSEEKIQLKLKSEKSAAAQEVDQLKSQAEELKQDLKKLEDENKQKEEELNERKAFLADAETQLESFDKRLNQTVEKVASLAFEGSLTAKIMAAADHWRAAKDDSTYKARVDALRKLPKRTESGQELNETLCKTLAKIRHYEPNDFVNLFVCLSQSFLTVLAGSPGSGKTSLCNYVARIFGLTSLKDQKGLANLWEEHPNFANRYIPVSVERGWTSKRDLIGYFNPLSRTFESVDPHRFECFKQLDYEAKENFEELPYFLLLDEANLSPMEYYFADFMNICDIRNDLSFVSIGGDSRFQIPDSLRFLATINNDHTTEMLSPRLVDRTWIIQLPETDLLDVAPQKADKILDKCKIIDWNLFRETYSPKLKNTAQLQKDLKKLSEVLSPLGLVLSPRTRIAIENYVSAAQAYMAKESVERTPYKVALDFAVAQKILPMINGSGEAYKGALDALRDVLAKDNLTKSASALEMVISKGTDAMDFYRFF